MLIDSIKENFLDPFRVYVSPSSPPGRTVLFKVIVSDYSYLDTFEFTLPVGPYHFLIWNPDPTPSSGQTIYNTLSTLGYNGQITTNILTEPLDLYQSLFVCLGVYPNNYRISANSQEALKIVNYLNNGGRVYMEGGEVWYYDPLVGGHNFNSLFGLTGISDGSGDMGPVVGFENTFSRGMYFNYAGENNYMDQINATTGFLIFRDGNNSYNCGVAYNPGNYRTIGVSFEFGGLIDGMPPSTKAILLDSIMKFFEITLPGIEENSTAMNVSVSQITCYPNPFSVATIIKPLSLDILGIKIYNANGVLVNKIESPTNSGNFVWYGTDQTGKSLPSGVYFVVPIKQEHQKPLRILLIKK
ncbi:MAG: T9SS type A sorting domain-containing protein [candidate division WOR-3 bacterium]|nr:T9SS type A sorting domain-containing protein [candidate division WOR-3 bacterium]MCX7757950.1 T9SS type A sorting domain-containing protein [candidate division WOR-3 bacterium]MDW7987297.1 T9SS type A sorting domain-containing protein [candidate division WOR-3 bacterium]